jgi:Zn-dependent protease
MLIRIVPLLFALTVHEYAHALAAYHCGDDTARLNGRLTLDPLAHLDFLGTLCLLFGPFGWAKPVPVNPYNFRRPRRDDIIVSLAGVAANLATAIAVALLMRLTLGLGLWWTRFGAIVWNMLLVLCQMSVGLMLFNLIPLPPLDGSHVLRNLLPYEKARAYDRLAPFAPFILLVLVLTPAIGYILGWPFVRIFFGLLGPAAFVR